MAWTAPRTWVVSEIVTASLMNTHVRDNLAYLKGQASTIAFEAGATFDGDVKVGALTPAGAALTGLKSAISTGGSYVSASDGTRTAFIGALPTFGIVGTLTNHDLRVRTNNAEVGIFTAGGRFGVGLTAPQGIVHTYDAISGAIKFEFDGVDGTARTVVPDGAGDVLYGVMPIWAVRHSGGGTQGGSYSTGGTALLAPSGTLDIYSSGGNILQLQVSAAGAITVQRTAGTGTYKVALWLLWL